MKDQTQIWSETFERDQSAQFEQDENVAGRVVAGVIGKLFPSAAAPAGRTHLPGREAHEAFLNGSYWQTKDSRRAMEFFEHAGKLDPQYADAWAGLAETAARRALSGGAPAAEWFESARSAAMRALTLDDHLAIAHVILANVLFWRDWQWAEAQRHYARAILLNPSLARAHHDYAFLLVVTGHPEAGVSSLRRAIALDPLSAHVNVDAGWVLLQAHHFEEAAVQAKRALELEPGMPEAQACLARAELYLGHRDSPVLDFYRRSPVSPRAYNRAVAAGVLGDRENAIRALDEAFRQRDTMMPLAGTEPAFQILHGDSRFRDIVRRMGLPD